MAALVIGAGVFMAQEYRFYNIAVNELFLYDWSYIWGELARTGGLATLIASFLSQFMHIPVAGPLIVTVIYVLVGWLFAMMLERQTGKTFLKGLAFLPVVWLFLCLDNDYYRLQGHCAYLMAAAAFYMYISIPEQWQKYRYALGLVLIPALYHLAGSVTVLLAVCLLSWELIRYGLKGTAALAYPAMLLLTAFLYVNASMADSWKHALTPYMYYDWHSTFAFPLTAWVLPPVIMWMVWLLVQKSRMLRDFRWCTAATFISCIIIAVTLYDTVHSRSYYRLIQQQQWAAEGDWDRIIETADRRQPNFLISYLNLALAQKGQLTQKLGYYNPQPVSKVMFPTHNLKTGLTLQSTVYLSWGYVSAARQAAFDANMVTPGMRNPQQLKVLVLTNIVLGAPQVARKYLTVLEKTLFYRGWARKMLSLMEDPDALHGHEELGYLYSALPQTEGYVRYEGLKGDMRDILDADPSNTILEQFHTAYLMLETLEER